MVTIYRNGTNLHICDDNENVTVVSVEEFFNEGFARYMSLGCRIYMYDLKFYGLAFIDRLYKMGLNDITEVKLSNPEQKVKRGEFTYILSADNCSFYNFTVNVHGKNTTICEFLNLVAVDMKDIVEEFGGEECVAMHRAVREIDSLGVRGTTISSCAYSVWKRGFDRGDFSRYFKEIEDPEVEKLCRDAYHGGMCQLYRMPGGYKNVKVLDANSLYPFIMRTCRFPIGEAHHGYGKMKESYMKMDQISYYVRFRCTFKLKENHIPFVHTRCDKRHWHLELLRDSCYRNNEGVYEWIDAPGEQYVDQWGEIHNDVLPIKVELCMYKPEFELFFEQYDVEEMEYLEYVWFYNSNYPFKNYVDHWYEIKKNAKTKAERRLSKMMLNALTGRMAFKKERESFYFRSDCIKNIEKFGTFDQMKNGIKGKYSDHVSGEFLTDYVSGSMRVVSSSMSHIQIGAAITSEAMVYMVRLAQKNEEHFIYSDTDSLHVKCEIEELNGVKIGDELGEFKIEYDSYGAYYTKEKVYELIDNDRKWKIVHAGLPSECQVLLKSFLDFEDAPVDEDGYKEWRLRDDIKNAGIDLPEDVIDKFSHDCSVWRKRIRGVRIPRQVEYIKNFNTMEIGKKNEYYTVDID